MNDYSYIRDQSKILINFKDDYLLVFIFGFFVFCIIWIFLMGFATPLAIVSGFIFGQWIGTLITLLGVSIGATFFYIFVKIYFKELVSRYLEKRISKFQNLFKKNELMYYMIFRLSGGAGIPFVLQNALPVLFNMNVKKYFYATIVGLVPTLFIINSLGSGLEKIVGLNESLNIINIISEPAIFIPILDIWLHQTH